MTQIPSTLLEAPPPPKARGASPPGSPPDAPFASLLEDQARTAVAEGHDRRERRSPVDGDTPSTADAAGPDERAALVVAVAPATLPVPVEAPAAAAVTQAVAPADAPGSPPAPSAPAALGTTLPAASGAQAPVTTVPALAGTSPDAAPSAAAAAPLAGAHLVPVAEAGAAQTAPAPAATATAANPVVLPRGPVTASGQDSSGAGLSQDGSPGGSSSASSAAGGDRAAPQHAPTATAAAQAPAAAAAQAPATPPAVPTDTASPATAQVHDARAAAAATSRGVGLADAVETVRLALRASADRGIAHARISLTPRELGGIEIHLRQTADGLVARVVAEHQAAAQLLHHAGAELRRSLESQGLTLLQLDVGTAGADADDAAGRRDLAGGGTGSGDGSATGGSGRRARAAGAASDAVIDPADLTTTTLALPNGALVDVLA